MILLLFNFFRIQRKCCFAKQLNLLVRGLEVRA